MLPNPWFSPFLEFGYFYTAAVFFSLRIEAKPQPDFNQGGTPWSMMLEEILSDFDSNFPLKHDCASSGCDLGYFWLPTGPGLLRKPGNPAFAKPCLQKCRLQPNRALCVPSGAENLHRHPQPLANDTECTNVPVTLEYEELNLIRPIIPLFSFQSPPKGVTIPYRPKPSGSPVIFAGGQVSVLMPPAAVVCVCDLCLISNVCFAGICGAGTTCHSSAWCKRLCITEGSPLEFTNAVFWPLNILACCFLSPQLTKLHQLAMQQSPFPLAPSSQGFTGKSRLSDTIALHLMFSVADGVDCVSVSCSWDGRFCTDRLSWTDHSKWCEFADL